MELAPPVKFQDPVSTQPFFVAAFQNKPILLCMMPLSAGARETLRAFPFRAARLASETPGQKLEVTSTP